MSVKSDGLPTGVIKATKNRYRWEIMVNGQRTSGYTLSIADAVRRREDAKRKGITSQGVRTQLSIRAVCNVLIGGDWSPTNSKNYRQFQRLAEFLCRYFGDNRQLNTIESATVDAFIVYLEERGLSGSTINRYTAALSKVFSTAVKRRLLEKSQVPNIPKQHEPPGRDRFLSAEEETAILDWCAEHNQRFGLVVSVLIDTGIRCGEFYKLVYSDFDTTARIIVLKDTKNGTTRSVPLTERAFNCLVELQSKYVVDGEHFLPRSEWYINRAWSKVKKALNKKSDATFVPHILRHTCCSRLVQRGASIYKVMRWAGHKSMETTKRYAHLRADDLVELAGLL